MQKHEVNVSDLDPYVDEKETETVAVYLASDVDARIAELEKDAARYRWLRDGNAYKPEGQCINGGEELDELCDNGLMDRS